MKAIKINTGDRFGRLTIINEVDMNSRDRFFKVKCDCGNEKIVRLASLRRGAVQSCGCLSIEKAISTHTKHGYNSRKNKRPEYAVWASMIQRCNNPKEKNYKNYGARGIKVCERWLDFSNFISDMGNRPKGLSIERINNDGNYEPNNCKWATVSEQVKNKRKKKSKLVINQ